MVDVAPWKCDASCAACPGEGVELIDFGGGEKFGGYVVAFQLTRGWRVYFIEVHESSFGGGWGRIDHAVHHRRRAIKSDSGRPLPFRPTLAEAAASLEAAHAAGELLPIGS